MLHCFISASCVKSEKLVMKRLDIRDRFDVHLIGHGPRDWNIGRQ